MFEAGSDNNCLLLEYESSDKFKSAERRKEKTQLGLLMSHITIMIVTCYVKIVCTKKAVNAFGTSRASARF